MSNMVILPIHRGCYYVIPLHEFNNYWAVPLMEGNLDNVPRPTKIAALKRGKGYRRTEQTYNQKGSGKHAVY